MKLLTTVIQGSFVQQHTWIWFIKNYLRFKELFKVYLQNVRKHELIKQENEQTRSLVIN